MTITPVYAAILTLIYVFLAWRVIAVRRGEKISLGDGGNKQLEKRRAAHSNFAEYAPLALVLLLMMELQQSPYGLVHLLGAALVLGRVCHAYGISQTPQVLRFRQVGMVLTGVVLISAAAVILWNSLTA